jgi:hypothetical protein
MSITHEVQLHDIAGEQNSWYLLLGPKFNVTLKVFNWVNLQYIFHYLSLIETI